MHGVDVGTGVSFNVTEDSLGGLTCIQTSRRVLPLLSEEASSRVLVTPLGREFLGDSRKPTDPASVRQMLNIITKSQYISWPAGLPDSGEGRLYNLARGQSLKAKLLSMVGKLQPEAMEKVLHNIYGQSALAWE